MTATGPAKRACDQCHTVKEKCRRTQTNASCERCHRLNQTCQTNRHAAKTGRKPRCSQRLFYTLPNPINSPVGKPDTAETENILSAISPYNGGLGANPAILSSLDKWERHFLNLMKDMLVSSPLDRFLVGPSFHESHHVSFIQNFLRPNPALKHAAVACAAILFGENNDENAKTSVEIGHSRAALAISSLRSFKIENQQDLATVLTLGVAMVTFALHVSDGQAFLISHYTLSLVKQQAHCIYALNSTMIDYWMCLVCTETFECLLKSEAPTMRVDPSRRSHTVDRYLGVSSTIFAHFYDICEVGSSLKNASMAKVANTMGCLASIEAAVDQWQTSPPSNFLDNYTQAEVLSMLSQAKIFRSAALLIIHRMRHPFGEQDREAFGLGRAIIDEFDMILQFTQRSIPCTALPYLAACFEVTDSESRSSVIRKSKDIVTFSKQSRFRFEKTLTAVWKARDAGQRMHWFELGGYAYLGGPGK